MKTPSIKEVKKYFKNAKEVRCIYTGDIFEIDKDTIHYDKGVCGTSLYWTKAINGDFWHTLVTIDEYAEIISYKQPKVKIRTELLKQLADNNSFSEQLIKKEFPQLFESETPTDIITIVEKYGKDKVIKLVEQYKK